MTASNDTPTPITEDEIPQVNLSELRAYKDYRKAVKELDTVDSLKALAVEYGEGVGKIKERIKVIKSEIDKLTEERRQIERDHPFGYDVKLMISTAIGKLILQQTEENN